MTDTVSKEKLLHAKYGALHKLINNLGSEAHARVAAHIRVVSNGKCMNIALYHVANTISMESKIEEYDSLVEALGVRFIDGKPTSVPPDWSKLKGQLGNGAKKAEPETTEVQRADPMDENAEMREQVRKMRETPPPNPVVLPPTPPPEPDPENEPTAEDDLAATLARALEKRMKPVAQIDERKVRLIVEGQLADLHDRVREANNNGSFPTERVQKLIDESVEKLRQQMVHRVVLVNPQGETKELKGTAHKSLAKLLKACACRDNILLVGPTGSGKTTAAEMVAEALGLEFYFNGAIDTEYKLKGFLDANGKLVSPAFRQAYEHGGVYLFDEVDASLPPAVLSFNAALANGWCDFPDGKVKRHKDCVIIAAANTWLGGATFDYVGRMKQDAAFADRFAMMFWDIDEQLEMAICSNKEWCKFVQAARANVVKHGLKVIISPRATLKGEKLLAAGLDRADVIAMCVRKGMTGEQWAQVMPEAE